VNTQKFIHYKHSELIYLSLELSENQSGNGHVPCAGRI